MLTRRVQYAARILTALATRDGETIPLRDLAARYDVPRTYLEAIMTDLRHGGIVASVRGKEGGYHLASPPATVTLERIVEILEPEILTVPEGTQEGGYPERAAWEAMHRHLASFLRSMTVEQMASRWTEHRNALVYSI